MARRRAQQRRDTKRAHRMRLTVGVIFLLLAAGVLIFNGIPSNELPNEVAVPDAYQMVNAGALLLDVRTYEEWDEVHVPGATLIPLDELSSRLNELRRDQDIVIICRSGNRSATARDILLKAGFPAVTSIAGGILDWQAAGYEVVSGP